MTKEELVKSLKKVKIVLGNGADLYCGLKTRYSDFFETKKAYYTGIKQSFHVFEERFNSGYKNNQLFYAIQCDFGNNPYLVKNIWDVLFALSFVENEDKILWCDIEKKMHDSFIKKECTNKGLNYYSKFHWDEIAHLVNGYKSDYRSEDEELYAAMISNIICKERNAFGNCYLYKFLKSQLIDFEQSFGKYIEKETAYTDDLKGKQESLINSLADVNEIVLIDTFNYSEFYGIPANVPVKHINGTTKSPIFGIDKSLDDLENDVLCYEASKYVKTSRRMDLEIIEDNCVEQKEFENVVVFGHSLNKQDYSYFYPLLDKIKIADTTANTRFVIAYNIFDESKADKIRNDLKQAVVNLFATYEKEHLGSHDSRLLDYLTTQDRVVFYKI